MKREEEIKQYCAEQGFPNGACSGISSVKAIVATEAIKWADKTMIEKVLTFISENFYDHPHVSGHICTDAFESLEQMEEEITKLMEA